MAKQSKRAGSDENSTPVIFRRDKKTNGVFAIFPTMVADLEGNVSAYAHIGQHHAADYDLAMRTSAPAAREEVDVEALYAELTAVGYSLTVYERRTSELHDEYTRELSETRRKYS